MNKPVFDTRYYELQLLGRGLETLEQRRLDVAILVNIAKETSCINNFLLPMRNSEITS